MFTMETKVSLEREAESFFRTISKKGYATTKLYRQFSSSVSSHLHVLRIMIEDDMILLSTPESIKYTLITPVNSDLINRLFFKSLRESEKHPNWSV